MSEDTPETRIGNLLFGADAIVPPVDLDALENIIVDTIGRASLHPGDTAVQHQGATKIKTKVTADVKAIFAALRAGIPIGPRTITTE